MALFLILTILISTLFYGVFFEGICFSFLACLLGLINWGFCSTPLHCNWLFVVGEATRGKTILLHSLLRLPIFHRLDIFVQQHQVAVTISFSFPLHPGANGNFLVCHFPTQEAARYLVHYLRLDRKLPTSNNPWKLLAAGKQKSCISFQHSGC